MSLDKRKNMTIKTYLQRCQREYYKGTPIISDKIYDTLAEKYNFYEVGTSNTENKVKHIHKMFSLKKVYDDEKYNIDFISKSIETPKLDGAAIELVYVHGELITASTRGDGIYGEDIFDKALIMSSIPNTINVSQELLQVTGEVVADISIENSRNYAAGALNLKDLEDFKKRNIFFIAYGVFPQIDSTYKSDMAYLLLEGFKVVTECLWETVKQDGVVIRCNSNKEFYDLGYTSRHPRGAYAIKNRSDVATEITELLDVVWQVGPSGKVTPVAIFEEVVIDDAKITRATLHNAGFIEELDLEIGNMLLITRSGGVIPKVVGKV